MAVEPIRVDSTRAAALPSLPIRTACRWSCTKGIALVRQPAHPGGAGSEITLFPQAVLGWGAASKKSRSSGACGLSRTGMLALGLSLALSAQRPSDRSIWWPRCSWTAPAWRRASSFTSRRSPSCRAASTPCATGRASVTGSCTGTSSAATASGILRPYPLPMRLQRAALRQLARRPALQQAVPDWRERQRRAQGGAYAQPGAVHDPAARAAGGAARLRASVPWAARNCSPEPEPPGQQTRRHAMHQSGW